jgi:hypothetical protein
VTPAARADEVPAQPISPFSPPAPRLPLESIEPGLREKIQSVLSAPTLSSRGLPETFNAEHHVYRYLLEHPDHSVKLWRQLGAKVADIDDKGGGRYLWQDEMGSEVYWHIAHRGKGLHVWYAEGKVKPALLLSAQPFRAVALMQYTEGVDTNGVTAVRHQVHFHLKCEGRAITLAAKILGSSAPHLAEQYLGQLQTFYGGMAWYLFQDADRAKKLFREAKIEYPAAQ